MRKLWLVLYIVLFCGMAQAQSKVSVGIAAGTSWYLGDINPDRIFYAPSPAGSIFLIYNFNTRYAIRTQLSYMNIRTGDTKPNIYYYSSSFSTTLMNADSRFEFNFRAFKMADRKKIFSPYVSAGLGYAYPFTSKAKSLITFPFGVGIKLSLSQKLGLGCEWQSFKTFTDKLDGQENPGYSRSLFQNNDWFTFFDVYIIYKIFDRPGECPAYEE